MKNLRINLRVIGVIGVLLVALVLLLGLTKGNVDKTGKLLYQNDYNTTVEGPFELSNTTARYALTKSVVDYKSLFYNLELATFSSPDVTFYNGKYFSIFTPGVSFAGVPFYIFGRVFGAPELFAFWMNTIVSVVNIFLVYLLAKRLGASYKLGLLSGIIFAFATNAFGFAFTFTQHPLSTMLILLGVLNALERRSIKNNILLGIIYTASLFMDIPNGILMLPVLLYAFSKHFEFRNYRSVLKIKFKATILILFASLIPLVVLFGAYNYVTTGSITKLAQNIGRTEQIGKAPPQNTETNETLTDNQSLRPIINTPFHTRDMLNGFYILLLSNERSWLFYSPVILLGICGLIFAYRTRYTQDAAMLVISVIGVNIVLYSMFGDPWGGWSFGARYLIPSSALLAAGVGTFLTRWRKRYWILAIFIVLFAYSVFVNVTGALTTNAVPPKIEAINFNPPIDYTYQYNFNFINENRSSSLLYNAYFKDKFSLWTLVFGVSGIIMLVGLSLLLVDRKEQAK